MFRIPVGVTIAALGATFAVGSGAGESARAQGLEGVAAGVAHAAGPAGIARVAGCIVALVEAAGDVTVTGRDLHAGTIGQAARAAGTGDRRAGAGPRGRA